MHDFPGTFLTYYCSGQTFNPIKTLGWIDFISPFIEEFLYLSHHRSYITFLVAHVIKLLIGKVSQVGPAMCVVDGVELLPPFIDNSITTRL